MASNTKRKPSGKGRGKWKHHRRDDGCSRGSGGGRGGDRGNDFFEPLQLYQKDDGCNRGSGGERGGDRGNDLFELFKLYQKVSRQVVLVGVVRTEATICSSCSSSIKRSAGR